MIQADQAQAGQEETLDVIALRAARSILHVVPWSDMSALMMGAHGAELLDRNASVRLLRDTVFSGAPGASIDAALGAVARAARDEGWIVPVENCWDSPAIDAWNRFAEGEDAAADEGPVPIMRGMMVSSVIWAATPLRHRKGSEGPRHIDAKIEHDLLWQRMKDVVPSLARALTTGTSEEWHDGARETLSSRASRRIKLAGWTPAVQERTGVTRPWSNLLVAPATAREATRDLEM